MLDIDVHVTCVLCRVGPDPVVAVPVGVVIGLGQRGLHHVGGHQRRVQAGGPGRGGPPLGGAQVQAQHELRQAEPSPALLLRQEHHDQGARQAIRLQVRLRRPHPGATVQRGFLGLQEGVPAGAFPVLPPQVPPSPSTQPASPSRPPHGLARIRVLSTPEFLLAEPQQQLFLRHFFADDASLWTPGISHGLPSLRIEEVVEDVHHVLLYKLNNS